MSGAGGHLWRKFRRSAAILWRRVFVIQSENADFAADPRESVLLRQSLSREINTPLSSYEAPKGHHVDSKQLNSPIKPDYNLPVRPLRPIYAASNRFRTLFRPLQSVFRTRIIKRHSPPEEQLRIVVLALTPVSSPSLRNMPPANLFSSPIVGMSQIRPTFLSGRVRHARDAYGSDSTL